MRIYQTHRILTPVGHVNHQSLHGGPSAFCVEAIHGTSLQLRWIQEPQSQTIEGSFLAHIHFFAKKELLLTLASQPSFVAHHEHDNKQESQTSWLTWHKLQQASTADLKIIGQYCLQYAHAANEQDQPQPRDIIKAGLGLESMAAALTFSEAKTPQDHQEVAQLRFEAFKRAKGLLSYQNSADDMLDAWDTTKDGAVTLTAKLRCKLIGTIRLAFAHGRSGSLPLLQYFPQAKEYLPPLHLSVELSRKAGDPKFFWGDTSLAFLRQAILIAFAHQRRFIVACVRANEQKSLRHLGFVPTGFLCDYPCSPPIKSTVLMIDLHALWYGKQGNPKLWEALFGAVTDQVPHQLYPLPNAMDRLRLTLLRTSTAVWRASSGLRPQQNDEALPLHKLLFEKTQALTYMPLR